MDLGPFFLFDETKRLEDIYLWLFNETGDLATRVEIRQELKAFVTLSVEEQAREIVSRLQLLCRDNAVPCIVDYGGLLTDPGQINPGVLQILEQFLAIESDSYLAFVSRRIPRVRDLAFKELLFEQGIPPLNDAETKLLLQQLLKRDKITASTQQLEELVEYLAGYPPAVYLAAHHAKTYGLSVLVADKTLLVDFQANRFTGLINKLALSDKEWFVLRYLSSEQVVPLAVIALAADVSNEEAAIMLRNLIEQSLIIVVDDNYGLSAPIRNAVERVKGNLDSKAYNAICTKLTEAFWSGANAAPTIEIVDATLHAAARTGSVELSPYSDLLRVSTMHRLALECYYRREWNQAYNYAMRARAMDQRSLELLELVFKCLVRTERFEQAENLLSEIKDKGARSFHYLRGFSYRMQRKYPEAVAAFEAAELTGNRSSALLRDHADCLHRIGKDREAIKKIEVARSREPANIYVLDLYIRISLATGQHKEAKAALSELERYDVDRRFIHHRRSTLLASQGLWSAALRETEAAIALGKATFEAHCQRTDILIELSRFPDALNELDRIRADFGNVRADVQMGLRCKLFIRQGDWRKAETMWGAFKDKTTEVNAVLLRQILDLKSRDVRLGIAERQQAKDELALLDPDLKNLSTVYSGL